MKFLNLIGSIFVWMVFILFISVVATFFISIFNTEGVLKAVELFKGILP